MLIRLNPDQYRFIQPLYQPLDYNLVIRSVIEGNTPAWVFADSTALPTLALLWDRQDAILIAGDPASPATGDLNTLLFEQILPDSRARWIPEMAVFYTPGWEDTLAAILKQLNPQVAGRLSYRFPRSQPLVAQPVPEGFEIRRIDDRLLASHLLNLDQVRGWIDSFWDTPADFLHTGFGYCAITGDTVASWCLTVFAAGTERELGLATIPEYRRKGLAACVAAAALQHAFAHEINPHWHCWADNLPSARVAEKLGFQLERKYQVLKIETGLNG